MNRPEYEAVRRYDAIHEIAFSILETGRRHGTITTVFVAKDEWDAICHAGWQIEICGARVLPL